MTDADNQRQRMCLNVLCSRRGKRTSEHKCPVCGFRTVKWDPNLAPANPPYDLSRLPPPPTPVLIVTTNDVPGCRISRVHGDVFGLTVRVRNAFSNTGAHLRSLVGGEVASYTKLLEDSRNEARGRLMDAARRVGANAVVAMRFDCNELGDIMTEIAAYGTAVTVEYETTSVMREAT